MVPFAPPEGAEEPQPQAEPSCPPTPTPPDDAPAGPMELSPSGAEVSPGRTPPPPLWCLLLPSAPPWAPLFPPRAPPQPRTSAASQPFCLPPPRPVAALGSALTRFLPFPPPPLQGLRWVLWDLGGPRRGPGAPGKLQLEPDLADL